MDNKKARALTEYSMKKSLANLTENYLKVWDEYYVSGTRDSAFLKDLVDAIQGIDAILEVYTREKYIDPDYALSELEYAKGIIESTIKFYEGKLKNGKCMYIN